MLIAAALLAVMSVSPHEQAFIKAYELETQGRHAAAAEAYRGVADDADGAAAAFARIRAAKALSEAGAHAEAEALLREIIAQPDGGAEMWLARVRLAETLKALALEEEEGRSREEEAAAFRAFLLDLPHRPWWMHSYAWEAADAMVKRLDLRRQAYAYFREIIETSESPADRVNAAGRLASSSDPLDLLTAAAGYLRAGDLSRAARALTAASPLLLERPDLHDRARDLNAWLTMGTGREEAGRAALRQAVEDYAESAWIRPALLYAVRNLSGEGRLNDAEAAAELLASRFPGSDEAGAAYYSLARAYARASRPADSHRAYARLAEAAPRHFRANEGLFLKAMDHLREGREATAKARLEQIVAANPGGRFASGARYWLGRMAQETGDADAAAGHYRAALTNTLGDFYAHRALGRLHGLAAPEDDGSKPLSAGIRDSFLRTFSPPSAPRFEADAPAEGETRLELLRFFARHGLEEAEWLALGLLLDAEADALPGLYWELSQAGLVETARGHQRRNLSPSTPEDEAFLEYLNFPPAFVPLVLEASRETGVAPHLLLAVALRESTFRAWVRSSAGARGVMQIMPATGTWLTQVEPALPPEAAQQLDRPLLSFRMGAYYLQRMIERSNSNLVYALVSYNAGPGNLDRWRRRFGDIDDDLFIESIPFPETRNYVKSVLGAYAAYRSLYPDLGASE